MGLRSNGIVAWMRERLALSGAGGFVVGLSGGLDSAVVARLCQLAAPAGLMTLVLPCHGSPGDEADAMLVASTFGMPVRRIDLAPAFDHLAADLRSGLAGPADGGADPSGPAAAHLPSANLKARLRMASLYYAANSLGYLVAGTGNRSELMLGYFTKYGDGGSDLLPIGGLLKEEVRTLARELGVPAGIVEKAPSAGLWEGQTDEQEMGFRYIDLERYVLGGPDAVAPALALRIERLIRASEHKRALPPVPPED